jgi:hypothetical protein
MEPATVDAVAFALGIDLVVIAILGWLPPKQVAQCAQVCSAWAHIIRWSNLLLLDVPILFRRTLILRANNFELFKFRLQYDRFDSGGPLPDGWFADQCMLHAIRLPMPPGTSAPEEFRQRKLDMVELITAKVPFDTVRRSPFELSIVEACKLGDLEIAKIIIDTGRVSSVNVQNGFHFACAGGHAPIVKWLVETGHISTLPGHWNVNFGCPDLNAAGKNGHKDLVYWLLSRFKADLTYQILAALRDSMRLGFCHKWVIDGAPFEPQV